MPKILAFTDLHMCDEGQTLIGIDPSSQFEQALDHALTHQPDADHLVLMGDLANTGKPSEYARVARALEKCPLPYTLMPGNHDNRAALVKALPKAQLTPQGHIQSVIDIGKERIITLDTLDGPPFRNDYHAGFLCEHRLNWLKAMLDGAQGKRVCLFTHHPIAPIGIDGIDRIGIRNVETLRSLLKSYDNIAHIFSGHVHRTVSGCSDGLSFTLFKSTCHQTPLNLTGRPDPIAVPEPAGYGVILLLEGSIAAHTEDFQIARHGNSTPSDKAPN